MIHWYKKLLTRCGHRPAKYPVHIKEKALKNLNKVRLPARHGPGGPNHSVILVQSDLSIHHKYIES